MAIVLITGSNSGFGFEAALAFARRGDRVYATVRNASRATPLQQSAQQEDLDIHIRILDVTQPDTFQGLIGEIVAQAGRIDVLVNNAGILRPGAWEDLPEYVIREVMETNFFGPMLLTRAVLPHMRKQRGGYIIMLSSLSGIAGLAGDVAYSASKFALEGAAEALRHEVDRWGIHLALVQGGQYATSIFEHEDSTDLDTGSPYQALVEQKLREVREGLAEAMPARIIGELLPRIADSDGSQLRWPADELAVHVLAKMHGQSDAERDAFLRMAGNSDWWSEGRNPP